MIAKAKMQVEADGIRARAAFLDALDMGLNKVEGTSLSRDDPKANEKLMAELTKYRKWKEHLYWEHTELGTSLKTLADREKLNVGLVKNIIENQRKKLLRKELEVKGVM